MPEADRVRLAARVQADYDGYGYAPLLADDLRAVAGLAADVSAGAASSNAAVAAANADRIAAAGSAAAAAATVSAVANRTVGRSINDTAAWSFTRSTRAWGYNSAGSLADVAVDAPLWAFDPNVLTPHGMSFTGARTNLIRNPRCEGATAGIVGSGGAVPTNWGFTNFVNSVCTVIGAGTELGVPYVEVRFDLTGAGNCQLHFETTTGAPAVGLTTYFGALHLRMVAGATTNFTNLLHTIRVDAVTAQNGANFSFAGVTSAALKSQRYVCSHTTLADATFARNRITLTSSATATITLRIGMPDMQAGPFVGPIILPTVAAPGASTRAQGLANIPVADLGTRWNYRSGVIIADWSSAPGAFTSTADADWFGICSWGDLTANERMGIVVNPAHTSVEARITQGGAAGTASVVSISAPAAGSTIRTAIAWDRDFSFLQVAARGTAGTKVALGSLPLPGWIMPGRYATSHPLFGGMSGLEIRPAALFDAALAALT